MQRLRGLSPTTVIALIALFAAIGGGSAIALEGRNSVDSGDIRNGQVKKQDIRKNAVRSVKVKNNNLRGADINESTLGQVPSAANADNAANAANAGTVNGMTIVPINHRSGDVTDAVLATINGLTLRVSCAGGAETITATTTETGAEISAISADASAADGSATAVRNQFDDTFSTGETFAVGPDGGAASDRQYTVTYSSPSGANVVATFVTEDDIGTNNCVVSGNAIG